MIIPIIQTSYSQYVESCEDPKDQKAFIPVDLEYEIEGGSVIVICKVVKNIEVVAIIDAHDDGQLTIHIPKKLVYSLVGTECEQGPPLIVDNFGEPASVKVSSAESENIITVGFAKGKHSISFIGTVILPDPSPNQYCGIVMGFDSLYLPPKFQIERGMKTEQVKCNKDLTLLKKASNDHPICVSFETGQKLLERNLAHTIARTGVADSDNENAHEKEITILSISPKNVTLPEPKNQKPKTTCYENGVCFTPE